MSRFDEIAEEMVTNVSREINKISHRQEIRVPIYRFSCGDGIQFGSLIQFLPLTTVEHFPVDFLTVSVQNVQRVYALIQGDNGKVYTVRADSIEKWT